MKEKFKTSDILNYTILLGFSIFCLLPMYLVIIVSFTDESVIQQSGYQLFPEMLSTRAYQSIFRAGRSIVNAYMVSIFVTSVGTVIAVLITGMAGYTLANRHVKSRDSLALFFFITMVFNGGLVPWYIMTGNLGLRDNVWALIVPHLLFSPFNMFLVRNFMRGIPDSLMESAKIDGAGESHIAFRIYFPLSIPVLAVITLFYGLSYWNNWFNAIMLVNRSELYPLQYLLFRLQSSIQMLADLQDYGVHIEEAPPTESLKMATAVVTTGPIIFLFPFLQRFFVKGLIIGSVKG